MYVNMSWVTLRTAYSTDVPLGSPGFHCAPHVNRQADASAGRPRSMETAPVLYCILSVRLYFIKIYLTYRLHNLQTIRLGTESALLSYCRRSPGTAGTITFCFDVNKMYPNS